MYRIRIPYPFGIEQGCYLDNWFKIQCDKTTGIPTLSGPLSASLQVFNISVEQGTLQVRSLVTFLNPATCGCPWPNSGLPANLTGTPFVYSQSNKLAVIGCGGNASMTLDSGTSVAGCSSVCNNGGELPGLATLDSCNGTNFCLADTPPMLTAFNYTYEASTVNTSGSEGCKFPFLVDHDSWAYNSVALDSVGNLINIPQLLDCNLNGYSTEQIYGRLDWTSDSSTNCTSDDRCSCATGYQGNPYIVDGCRDTPSFTCEE